MTQPTTTTLTTQQAALFAAALQAIAQAEALISDQPAYAQAQATQQASLASLADALTPGVYQVGQHRIERGQRVTGALWQCDGYQGITLYHQAPGGRDRMIAAFWNVAAWQAATGNLGQVTRQTQRQAAA